MIDKVMKRLLILIVLLLPAYLFAQVEYAEEKSQVNTIKKDANYLYGEGIGDTAEDAMLSAKDFLTSDIKRYIQEEVSLVDASSISIPQLVENADKIQFKRGTMDRIFLYVKKTDILNTPSSKTPIAGKETKTEKKEMVAEPEAVKAPEVEKVPEVAESPEIIKVEETPEVTTAAKPAIETQESPMLNKLLSSPDMETLISILKAAKEAHKVIWGDVKLNNINPSWYIVSFSENEINAFLDKGAEERINLLTKEKVSLKDYSNNRKVWFIIYEN